MKRFRGEWHCWGILNPEGQLILVAPTRQECRELKEPGERIIRVRIHGVAE